MSNLAERLLLKVAEENERYAHVNKAQAEEIQEMRERLAIEQRKYESRVEQHEECVARLAEAEALLRDAQTYAIDIQDFVLESGYKAAAVECADRIDAYLSRKEQP